MMNEQLENMRQMRLGECSDEIESGETIYIHLPYSSLKRWLYEGSIYERAHQALPIARLSGVRSLSFLSYVGKDRESLYYACPSSHTRYDHSLIVAMVSEEILKQNCFPLEDINKGVLAGLIHDIATPAHGDATKILDLENLEEEDFWAETIGQEGLDFISSYGVGKEEMDQIVHNQGILGKVLDIADRVTYTMKDLYYLYNSLISPRYIDPVFFPLQEIVTRDPQVGDIYKDVNIRRSTGDVFFSNPDKLFDFLKLRAIMSKNYYHNPSSQGRDFFIKLLMEPLYSTIEGDLPLNPINLRRMSDNQLLEIISQSYEAGLPICIFDQLVNWHPKYEVCATWEEAKQKESALRKEQYMWVLGIRSCKGFNTASNTLVFYEGQIIPLNEAMPWKTAELDEMSDALKGFYVFYTPLGDNNVVDLLFPKLSEKRTSAF